MTGHPLRGICKQRFGHLQCIFINFFQTISLDNYNSGVWLSLTDATQEGVHVLSDGSPMTFTDWQPGQPDSWAEADDCVNGWVGIQLQWNDINCGQTFWFICEYET